MKHKTDDVRPLLLWKMACTCDHPACLPFSESFGKAGFHYMEINWALLSCILHILHFPGPTFKFHVGMRSEQIPTPSPSCDIVVYGLMGNHNSSWSGPQHGVRNHGTSVGIYFTAETIIRLF